MSYLIFQSRLGCIDIFVIGEKIYERVSTEPPLFTGQKNPVFKAIDTDRGCFYTNLKNQLITTHSRKSQRERSSSAIVYVQPCM